MLMIIVLLRYYEGSLPVVVTSDPEMIKEVFIKQFHNFHGRRVSVRETCKLVNMFSV